MGIAENAPFWAGLLLLALLIIRDLIRSRAEAVDKDRGHHTASAGERLATLEETKENMGREIAELRGRLRSLEAQHHEIIGRLIAHEKEEARWRLPAGDGQV